MDKVNEGSASHHQFTLDGANGLPIPGNPETLQYRLMASETETIIDWTQLPVSAREVVISGSHNTITGGKTARYLTIKATHSGGEEITSELRYSLINLMGV